MWPEGVKLESPVRDINAKGARARRRTANIAPVPAILPNKERPAFVVPTANDDSESPWRIRPIDMRLRGKGVKLYACPPEGG